MGVALHLSGGASVSGRGHAHHRWQDGALVLQVDHGHRHAADLLQLLDQGLAGGRQRLGESCSRRISGSPPQNFTGHVIKGLARMCVCMCVHNDNILLSYCAPLRFRLAAVLLLLTSSGQRRDDVVS